MGLGRPRRRRMSLRQFSLIRDLPQFDPTADSVRYDEWWGQRLLDKRAAEPAYPFGFGLGYSRVEFSDPKIFMVGEQSAMEVTARNSGDRATATIAQAYAHDATSQVRVPIRRLVGFARVALEPEETKRVRIPLDLTALHHRIASGEWTRRDGDWRIAVASRSRDTGTDTRAVF